MHRALLVPLTATMIVLAATAAGAHPAFNPNAIPVGEPVASVLVVPHGCAPGGGMPEEGGEVLATVRVDLAYTDQVAIESAEVDGWDVADDGEAIVWTDAGGATTDPIEFPVTLTVSGGAVGDVIHLPAYQECEGGDSFRWIARPGEDGFPAVRLEVTSGEVASHAASEEAADHGDMPMSEGETMSDHGSMAMPSDEATEAASAEPTGSNGSAAILVVAGVVAAAAVAGVLVRRRHAA